MPKITIYIFLVVHFIISCSPIHKYSKKEGAIACAGVTEQYCCTARGRGRFHFIEMVGMCSTYKIDHDLIH